MNLVPVPDAETVPDTDRETQTRIPFEPCVIRGTDHIGGPEQIQPHIPILSHYYRRQRKANNNAITFFIIKHIISDCKVGQKD